MIHSFLIKPASSLCNMRCKYCFYANVSDLREIKSYGIMQLETTEKLIDSVFSEISDGDTVQFAFQGGEPTMAGFKYFEHFISYAKNGLKKRASVQYSLQTNGLLLDDSWCKFLAENKFLVGLSLDGTAAFHDENRIDAANKGTWRRILDAKKCLEKHRVEYNILWVLTNSTARYPQKVWSFLCEQDIKYVQFIPCLSDLESDTASPHSLSPKRFASFYSQLFRYWANALYNGQYRSIKLFDDICNLLGRNAVTACGFTGKCQIQCIIEADGSVYPCDFYVLDSWNMGNITQLTPSQLKANTICDKFLMRKRTFSSACESCRFTSLCGGGCPRMAQNMYLYNNDTCCGYKELLQSCGAELQAIANKYAR